MKWLAMASAICFCMGASAASAQEPSDVLHVSGQADFLQSATGGTGVVEWIRTAQRDGVRLGAQSGSMSGAWWTFARAGGFVRRRGSVFSGTLEAGGGRNLDASFGYQRVSAGAAAPLAKGRVVLETEGQLARVASDVSRVLRLGATWQLSNAVAAGGGYYLLSHNRSASPAVCARLDVEHGRASVLGGVILAQSDRPHVLLSEIGGLPRTSTELFGGWGLRAASYRLLIVANVSPSSRGANRVLVSVRIPLRSAAGTPGTAREIRTFGIDRVYASR